MNARWIVPGCGECRSLHFTLWQVSQDLTEKYEYIFESSRYDQYLQHRIVSKQHKKHPSEQEGTVVHLLTCYKAIIEYARIPMIDSLGQSAEFITKISMYYGTEKVALGILDEESRPETGKKELRGEETQNDRLSCL